MQGASDPQPQLIERKPVAPADQNNPVYFNVFQSLFQDDGVYVFTYEVERPSGNSGPSTASWGLYHRDLPGGNISGTGAHPNLRISLPPELGNPPQIGKDEVDRGVAVTLSYPIMRAYDVIFLELNRVRFTFTVQPGEETKPFVITVTRSMFEQAGSRPEFEFSYTVKDQVNNTTQNRRWSIVIKADVDTERVTLEKAILREILNDNTDNPNTVELPKLNGGPLWALIHLIGKIWNAGDEIHLTFTSMLGGSQVAIHEATFPITQIPGQFSWDIPNNKVIADSIVRVSYKQIRGGKVIGASEVAEAEVRGEGSIKLTRPKLVAPAVDPVDLWLYKNGVTVRIEFLTALVGDKARLIEIKLSGAQPFPAVEFNANKRTNTVLTQAFLAARHGQRLEFCWALIREGKEIARSMPLALTVKEIEDEDARLPVAEILQGKEGRLNLDDFVGDATFKLLPWAFIAVGQEINVTVVDKDHAPLLVLQNYPITEQDVTNGLTQAISRPWLDTLFDNAEITIKVEVTVGGRTIVFKDVIYTVSLRSFTGYEDFDSSHLIGFNPGSEYTFASGIKLKSWAGIVHLTNIHTTDPNYTPLLGRVTLNMLGTVELTLPGLARHVSFLFDSHQLHEENAVVFMDERGQVIGMRPLTYTNLYQYAYVSFSATGNSRIKSFIIRNGNDMYVDRIEVR